MNEGTREEDYGQELESQFIIEDEGQIEIAPGVIGRIVEIAASEIEGVSFESRSAWSKLLRNPSGESPKGISVQKADMPNSVSISLAVRMIYGLDMYETAIRLRKHIKETVEKLTRTVVRKVDIQIAGIVLPSERERERREVAGVGAGATTGGEDERE